MFEVAVQDMTSHVLATMIQDLNDDLADRVFAGDGPTVDIALVERMVGAYTAAIERVLGAPHDSVEIDMTALRAWVEPLRPGSTASTGGERRGQSRTHPIRTRPIHWYLIT